MRNGRGWTPAGSLLSEPGYLFPRDGIQEEPPQQYEEPCCYAAPLFTPPSFPSGRQTRYCDGRGQGGLKVERALLSHFNQPSTFKRITEHAQQQVNIAVTRRANKEHLLAGCPWHPATGKTKMCVFGETSAEAVALCVCVELY